jgi:carbonic anhydrase/acetyltransferase-like protein (isoleucine patch superfamily)
LRATRIDASEHCLHVSGGYLPRVPIYALGDVCPQIDQSAFVHPDAVIIGDVQIGAETSVWPTAVLRGDGSYIRIGARSSIQDGCVIHTDEEWPTTVGDGVVVGHLAHLEGCTIKDNCLIGVGAVVLHRVVVHSGAIVAANTVLLNDAVVPPGALAVGSPAVIKEGRARPELITDGVESYLERVRRYPGELRRIG